MQPVFVIRPSRQRKGFSLVEVVMALGIMSFALMGLVGLLPAGLSQFRQAIDLTVKAQIAQELISMVQRTDYADLAALGTSGQPAVYYYDSEGAKLTGADEAYYAYVARTQLASDGDLRQLLAPTWSAAANGKPLNNVSAVRIEIVSRTAPDRPYTCISYVANTGT